MAIYRKTGDKVVALRKKKGWSQKTLAEATGRTMACISNIETNFRIGSEGTHWALAKVFGVTMDQLHDGVPLEIDLSRYAKKKRATRKPAATSLPQPVPA